MKPPPDEMIFERFGSAHLISEGIEKGSQRAIKVDDRLAQKRRDISQAKEKVRSASSLLEKSQYTKKTILLEGALIGQKEKAMSLTDSIDSGREAVLLFSSLLDASNIIASDSLKNAVVFFEKMHGNGIRFIPEPGNQMK